MATSVKVDIQGLTEVNKALRRMDADLPKAMRMALNDAADLIVSEARPRVAKRSGRARGTMRTQSTRTEARVTAGGSRAPYYPWLDFGGRVGRARSVSRPVLSRGRYIYDAYFRNRDEFRELLVNNIKRVASSAGLELQSGQ